jgi:hypothetical protein
MTAACRHRLERYNHLGIIFYTSCFNAIVTDLRRFFLNEETDKLGFESNYSSCK